MQVFDTLVQFWIRGSARRRDLRRWTRAPSGARRYEPKTRTIVATAASSSIAAAQFGSVRSASRSAQKTYSQAAPRLGRDSSLDRLIERSANTRRACRSVPGLVSDAEGEGRPEGPDPVAAPVRPRARRRSRGRGTSSGCRARPGWTRRGPSARTRPRHDATARPPRPDRPAPRRTCRLRRCCMSSTGSSAACAGTAPPGPAPGCASRRAGRRRWPCPGSAARHRSTGTTTSPVIASSCSRSRS